MPDIVVHSKTTCPSCVGAKAWLEERGFDYTLHVYDDFDARQEMYDSFGLEGNDRTVPQIVIDGVRIGGFDKLKTSNLANPQIDEDIDF